MSLPPGHQKLEGENLAFRIPLKVIPYKVHNTLKDHYTEPLHFILMKGAGSVLQASEGWCSKAQKF